MTILERRKRLMIVSGILMVSGFIAAHFASNPYVGPILLTTAAIVAGSDIAVRAWNSLRVRHVSIELLVTIAATGGILIGIYEEAAAVTFLFLLGAYLEERTIRRTRGALDNLISSAPSSVLLIDGEDVREVPVRKVSKGDLVRVLPGAHVPVDGVVVKGHSTIDESTINGEPLPAEKTSGASVYAGTVNRTGVIDVEATKVGAETALARIIRRVEEAQEAQVPVQRFIERFARWYTPAMILMSIATFLISGDIVLALTLLVIACPGALVVATPVAIAAGIGRAARTGMLIKGGAYLETVGKVNALVLDKTGTLTEGRPRITDVIPLGNVVRMDESLSTNDALVRWAAIAEAGSSHPLAIPIVSEAEKLGPIPTADTGSAAAGKGVEASWNGHRILVGRTSYLQEEGVAVTDEAAKALDHLHDEGKTGILVSVDGEVQGAIGVADSLCESAAELIGRLPSIGIERVVMATGDNERVARVIAERAGIDEVFARQMPEDKPTVIRQLQEEGYRVAFAGDGINDAPALVTADVGIAMGGNGADVAIEAADVALMTDDLAKIPEAILLSRSTMRVIRQNLVIALGTVALLLAGVLGGIITMGSGMLIHEASLLLVVLNSVRLMKRPRPRGKASIHSLECKTNLEDVQAPMPALALAA